MVITTYNRPDALAAVVEACFVQSDKNFEIIIADDGSTANTRRCVDALRKRSPVPLKHVWQSDRGFRAAMARNRATQAARGEYVVFLDGDCIPQRDFISQHRKLARRGHMVRGSRVLLSPVLTRRVLDGLVDLPACGALRHVGLRLGGHMNKLLQVLLRWPDIGRESTRFSWRRIKSCNLGVWRCDLDTVDGFDESFQGWGHEDADLAVRLFNAGVMRKDGAFATEVFHLYHQQAERNQAAGNRAIVLERAANKTILPTRGMASRSVGQQ